MIAIFHTLPKLEEIKRNYLFFDEIQTSEKFLSGNLQLLRLQSNTGKQPERIDDFQREIDFLFENDIVKPKEDIEQKLIPEIGSFNPISIESKLKRLANEASYLGSTLPDDDHIIQFYKNILILKDQFDIDIIGDSQVLSIAPMTIDFNFLSHLLNRNIKTPEGLLAYLNDFSSTYSRIASIVLNGHFNGQRYYPLIEQDSILNTYSSSGINFEDIELLEGLKSKVVNLVVQKMPVPDESVSWEQLTDFKSDPDSTRKVLGLQTWITDISKQKYTLSEIEERLRYSLSDYEYHFKKHKIKYRLGIFETVLLPTLEALENFVKLKFSKGVEALFSIGKGNFQLFEAESKFPGREVAYLHKTNDFFGTANK